MHIRFMQRADIPAVVDIALDAFSDDVLLERLGPRSSLYENQWRAFNLSDIMKHFLAPNCQFIVCVTDLGDEFYDYTKGEEIMGYCTYDLHILSDKIDKKDVMQWTNPNDGLGLRLDRMLRGPLNWWTNFSLNWFPWMHPALDRSEINYLRSLPNFWDGLPYYLDVSNIAVFRKFHRKGVASMMLNWGINYIKRHDEATGQHTPLVLHASPMGFGLYKKLGFKTLGYAQFTKSDNPNGPPYTTPGMVLDPHEIYTDSVDIKDEKGRAIAISWKKTANDKTDG